MSKFQYTRKVRRLTSLEDLGLSSPGGLRGRKSENPVGGAGKIVIENCIIGVFELHLVDPAP